MAELTGAKRTEVIKNALGVYVARQPSGQETTLETVELANLSGKGHRFGPDELGLLAGRLVFAADPMGVADIRERMTRGFYGI